MENASKALIIAGAILLSIAIIAIGMTVYNMASSAISGTDLSSQEVTSYNSEWLAYEGTITGTNAKALCTAVISHNNSEDDDSYMIRVLEVSSDLSGEEVDDGETSDTTSSEITTVRNSLNSGSKYYISFNYTSNGLIKEIGIRNLNS